MDEWHSIENNPGVYTELLKNIGVKGVQVEEILSFDALENQNSSIYGIILLYKYINDISYTPNILQFWDKDLFFSRQIIANANATQTLLSIILNNSDKIDIGETLKELKINTIDMDPLIKGLTLSNCEKIKTENNKFNSIEKGNDNNNDIYHFISFIHFKNAIYEIDGFQEGPILLEKNIEFNEWPKKIKPRLNERINLFINNDIKFNLFIIVPDKIDKFIKDKDALLYKKNYIEQRLKENSIIKNEKELEEYNKLNKEQLQEKLKIIETEIKECENGINIEKMKMNKYREDNKKNQHDFTPLIFELLNIMGQNGIIQNAYKEILTENK